MLNFALHVNWRKSVCIHLSIMNVAFIVVKIYRSKRLTKQLKINIITKINIFRNKANIFTLLKTLYLPSFFFILNISPA